MLLNKDEEAAFFKSKSVVPMERIKKDGNFKKCQTKNHNHNQNEDYQLFRFHINFLDIQPQQKIQSLPQKT